MLVSSITRFNAANIMNNSAYNMTQASSNMVSAVNNNHTFGGEHDLSMLNRLDNKLSLDLLTNKFLYKMASLQEKMAQKHNSLNVLA